MQDVACKIQMPAKAAAFHSSFSSSLSSEHHLLYFLPSFNLHPHQSLKDKFLANLYLGLDQPNFNHMNHLELKQIQATARGVRYTYMQYYAIEHGLRVFYRKSVGNCEIES
jgi:hypothetical protein